MSEQPNSDNSRQDALRTAQKQITRSLLLALAALGVIVIACYAWFVRNTSVSGALGSISAGTGNFELASVGGVGAFDDLLPAAEKIEGDLWPDEQNTGRSTGSASTILWRIDQTSSHLSHLGNYTQSTGIEPGSWGTLQFYVVPKRAGDLNLTFTIEIIPLVLKNNVYEPISDAVASGFLTGHLLLNYRVGIGQAELIDPTDGSFALELKGLTPESDSVLISLDWNWPFLLENAVSDPEVKKIIEDNPECFFHDGNNPLTGDIVLPDKNDPEFRRYSNFYNNADQYIGNKVDAVLFRLNAEES